MDFSPVFSPKVLQFLAFDRFECEYAEHGMRRVVHFLPLLKPLCGRCCGALPTVCVTHHSHANPGLSAGSCGFPPEVILWSGVWLVVCTSLSLSGLDWPCGPYCDWKTPFNNDHWGYFNEMKVYYSRDLGTTQHTWGYAGRLQVEGD